MVVYKLWRGDGGLEAKAFPKAKLTKSEFWYFDILIFFFPINFRCSNSYLVSLGSLAFRFHVIMQQKYHLHIMILPILWVGFFMNNKNVSYFLFESDCSWILESSYEFFFALVFFLLLRCWWSYNLSILIPTLSCIIYFQITCSYVHNQWR